MSSPMRSTFTSSSIDPDTFAIVPHDSQQPLPNQVDVEQPPPYSHEDELSALQQEMASLHQQLQLLAAQNKTLKKTCMYQMRMESQARLLEAQVEALQHQLVVLRTRGEDALQAEIRHMAEKEPELAEEQFLEEVEEIILEKDRPKIKRILALLQALKEQEEKAVKADEERARVEKEYQSLALDDWELLEPSQAEVEQEKNKEVALKAKQESLQARLEELQAKPEELKVRSDTNIAHLKELKELLSALKIEDEEALLGLFPGTSISPLELDFVIVEDDGQEIQYPGFLSRIYSKLTVAESTFDQVNSVWSRVSKVKTCWDWGWWVFKYAGPVLGTALLFI